MRRLASFVSLLLLVGGCAAAASSPSPSTPAVGFALRAWITQALPPVGAFGSAGPSMAIDHGRLIAGGPVPAVYPGPLLPNLQQRSISQAGIDAVVAAARAAGLLDAQTDFTDSQPLFQAGSQTGHLLFVIDGVEREVLGDPNRVIMCIRAPCIAPPGTPEAFGQFWMQVHDLSSLIGGELGAETPYTLDRVAVLLMEPVVDATLQPSFARWPLAGPMATFGVEWQGSPARCGVIEGADLVPALLAFRSANALTRWTDDGATQFGAVVRALFPSEPDPC